MARNYAEAPYTLDQLAGFRVDHTKIIYPSLGRGGFMRLFEAWAQPWKDLPKITKRANVLLENGPRIDRELAWHSGRDYDNRPNLDQGGPYPCHEMLFEHQDDVRGDIRFTLTDAIQPPAFLPDEAVVGTGSAFVSGRSSAVYSEFPGEPDSERVMNFYFGPYAKLQTSTRAANYMLALFENYGRYSTR